MKSKTRVLISTMAITLGWTLSTLAQSESAPTSAKVDPIEEKLKFKSGDEQGNDQKALHAEILIEKSEKKALVQLQRLIKMHHGGVMEADLMFREAELYMRRARSQRFFESHRDSEFALTLVPRIIKNASERAEMQAAVQIYEQLQKNFPKYHSLDMVIFNEGFAREQLGDMKEAEFLFLKIPAQFPDSSLIADSWLSLGEISYQSRQFGTARERFLKIKNFPEARAYPYALYKAAWCLYNLQDATGAIKQLEEVVAFGRDAAKNGLDSKLDLRKEALGDMALFYSDQSPSSHAVAYFKSQAQELSATPYILKLVEIYKRHSRYKDIEIVLNDLKKEHSTPEETENIYAEMVANYEHENNREMSVSTLEKFAKNCSTPACAQKVSEIAKNLAGRWHAIWKKRDPSLQLAGQAEKAYAVYLAVNPTPGPENATAHFAYAELLFNLKKYRQASEQYVLATPAKSKMPFAQDAEYGAILSLEQAVEPNWTEADEKKFNQLADQYIKDNPKGTYRQDVEFKSGFLAYEKQRWDEASERFHKLGWSDGPDSDKKKKAQDLYLDILNQKKAYTPLKQAVADLMSRLPADSARAQGLNKIYQQSYFAEVQNQEQSGKEAEAVAGYQQFATENPNSELAPKAYWNASQLLFKTGQSEAGAKSCLAMYKQFPKNEQTKDCLLQAASTFESMARLDLAADALLDLAKLEELRLPSAAQGNAKSDQKSEAKKDQWTELAADYLALSGKREEALNLYKKLAESLNGKKKLAILKKIIDTAQILNNDKLCADARKAIVMLGIEPEAGNYLVEDAEALLKDKDFEGAFSAARKIINQKSLNSANRARARMIQAQILVDEFNRQSVKARPERLSLVLNIKTEKLEKAQSALQEVIRFGDSPTSVKALHELSHVYRSYSTALRTLPMPEGLAKKDADDFQAELERLATPLEEKGVESLAQALQLAKKAKLHDGSLVELQAEFNKANLKGNMPELPELRLPRPLLPKQQRQTLAARFNP